MEKPNRDAEQELLERAVRAAAQWMFILVDSVDQLTMPPGYRQLVAAMYQHMAIEHFKGIITLVADGLHTPARALVRPQIEAHLRGRWAMSCATDQAVLALLNGEERSDPPPITALTKVLEEKKALCPDDAQAIRRALRHALHDLTHGGTHQLRARLVGHSIEEAHPPRAVVRSVLNSALFSCLAGQNLANWADSMPTVNRLRDGYREHLADIEKDLMTLTGEPDQSPSEA